MTAAWWPMTGRDDELRRIADAIETSGSRGLMIGGVAGVGKTRLAADAVEAAESRGWRVPWVVGTAAARSVPLGAFAQWADANGGSPLQTSQSVIDALLADGRGRVLLTVDDAHLLDDLSAFVMLQFILRRAGKVLATIRTGELAPDSVTLMWKDELLPRIELEGLSRHACADLLSSALGQPVSSESADRLWKLTHGNMVLLRHLVNQELDAGRLARHKGHWRLDGETSLSRPLRELVELQVGSVPDAVLDVVDLVAVAEPIDRHCLQELTDEEALERAEQQGLITTDAAEGVRIGHPLYAEVRLAQAGRVKMRRLRGRVITAMRDLGLVPVADPVRLALLWLQSDLPADPKVLTDAAEAAATQVDAVLAERLARAAVAAGGGTKATILHAHALGLLGREAEARRVMDSVDSSDVPGTTFANDVIVRANYLMGAVGRMAESRRVIDDALGGSVTGVRANQLRTFQAVQILVTGRPPEALAVLETVDLAQLDSFGQVVGRCARISALGELGRSADARVEAEQSYTVVDTAPSKVYPHSAIGEVQTTALLLAGHIADAAAVAERHFERYKDSSGLPRAIAVGALGLSALANGDLAAARRWLHPAELNLDLHHESVGLVYRWQVARAEALARSGEVEEAAKTLGALDGDVASQWGYLEPARSLADAWVLAGRGQLLDARELVRVAAVAARERGQLAREVLCLQIEAQFGGGSGADRLDELAAVVDGPRVSAAQRYSAALTHGAAAALDAVSHEFEAMGDRLAAADAAAHAARAYRATGKRGSELTAANRAHRLAKDCGGAVSPALTSTQTALPFTQREHEVAVLVSQGLSNKAISEVMQLSVRTIEGHIYRARMKANAATRAELTRLIRESTP